MLIAIKAWIGLFVAVETLIKHIEPEDRGFFELGGAIGDLSG